MMDVVSFINQQKTAMSELVFHITEPGVLPRQRHERIGQFKAKGNTLIKELVVYRSKLSSIDEMSSIETAIKELMNIYKDTMDKVLASLDPNEELSAEILNEINRSVIPEALITGENKMAALGINTTAPKKANPMGITTPTATEKFTMTQLFGLNLSMKITEVDGEDLTGATEFIYVINPVTVDGAVVVTKFITPQTAIDFVNKDSSMMTIEPLIIFGKPCKLTRTATLDIV